MRSAMHRASAATGMPLLPTTRARVVGTSRACRAVVAARILAPGTEWQVFRALQFAWFTTTLLLDEGRLDPGGDRRSTRDRRRRGRQRSRPEGRGGSLRARSGRGAYGLWLANGVPGKGGGDGWAAVHGAFADLRAGRNPTRGGGL